MMRRVFTSEGNEVLTSSVGEGRPLADLGEFHGVPLSDENGKLVRRQVPADNSCLFNSLGYALQHTTGVCFFVCLWSE